MNSPPTLHLNGALPLESSCDNLNANTVKANSPEHRHTQLESVIFNQSFI